MIDLIRFIVKNIVNNPEEVDVTESEGQSYNGNSSKIYTIQVNPSDIALIIGKGGQTIKSIRTIVKTKAIKEGVFVDVRVADDNKAQSIPSTEE